MTCVCILRSTPFAEVWYAGLTHDLKARLRDHNVGRSVHTSKCRPWALVAYFAFADVRRAVEFEKYLKSGSRRAFARKHFR